MRVNQRPQGSLYRRVENLPMLDQPKADAGEYRWNPDSTSHEGWPLLTAEAAGRAWLFIPGPRGAAASGGTKVAKIGPVPPMSAPEYLLRANYGSGPPGTKTPDQCHSGSEVFYVVAEKLSQSMPDDIGYVGLGHTMNSHMAGMSTEVFRGRPSDLTALTMYVVYATKPFSVLAQFE